MFQEGYHIKRNFFFIGHYFIDEAFSSRLLQAVISLFVLCALTAIS